MLPTSYIASSSPAAYSSPPGAPSSPIEPVSIYSSSPTYASPSSSSASTPSDMSSVPSPSSNLPSTYILSSSSSPPAISSSSSSPSAPSSTCGNYIVNGGFEAGLAPWTESATDVLVNAEDGGSLSSVPSAYSYSAFFIDPSVSKRKRQASSSSPFGNNKPAPVAQVATGDAFAGNKFLEIEFTDDAYDVHLTQNLSSTTRFGGEKFSLSFAYKVISMSKDHALENAFGYINFDGMGHVLDGTTPGGTAYQSLTRNASLVGHTADGQWRTLTEYIQLPDEFALYEIEVHFGITLAGLNVTIGFDDFALVPLRC